MTHRFIVRIATALAVLASAGCLARKPSAQPAAAPPAAAPPAAHASAAPATRAAVTGVVLRRGDAIEICPGRSGDACAGIRVQGDVQDAWISKGTELSVWRLTGAFDGTTLVLDAPAQPVARADAPDYRNSCPELQQPKPGVNPDPKLQAAVEAAANEHRERIAGQWWDRERQTMVIWVTGDPTELRRQLATRSPSTRICVQGQARFSEAELERARTKADAILREHGVVWSSSAGDVTRNQIIYEAEAIDQATLAELAQQTGDAIRVVAFVELLNASLAQLPVPAARGDVALVTDKARSGASMAALGRFSVHYDAALRCVYFSTPDERVLPVWPYGFWATSSPLKIYDYDDNLVAQEGETIELGGGQVDVEHVRTDNACGAKQAWIAGSRVPARSRDAR